MFGKVTKYIVLGTYALCALVLLVFAVPATGLSAKSVATGSMQPALPEGSLVIIQRTPLAELAAGDIITYTKSQRTGQTVTHRVTGVEKRDGAPYFVTKGDANTAPDPAIPGGAVVGQVRAHVPYLGAALDWIKTPLGAALLVVIPGFILIVRETQRLNVLLAPVQTVPLPAPATRARPLVRRRLDGLAPRVMSLLLLVTLIAPGAALATFQSSPVTLANNSFAVQAITKDNCKNGGWATYGFKNQGQCIAYVNRISHSAGSIHVGTATNTNNSTTTITITNH